MMKQRHLYLIYFVLCAPLYSHASPIPQCMAVDGTSARPMAVDLKEAIRTAEKESCRSDCAQGLALLRLSKLYYQDQDHEKAFRAFLKALESADILGHSTTPEDDRLYAEALSLYLDPHAQSTKETASVLLSKYKDVIKENQNYHQLAFLVAASYANAGQFSDFFDVFYRSYQAYPTHYLSYKTKAILHIKLFEKATTPAAKEDEKQNIVNELLTASEIYPKDHTLYKMMLAFSPSSQREKLLNVCLKKIVDDNMVIPRTDIEFYVEIAVKEQQYENAQKLLDKAREWFQYSRIINSAQNYLDQHKKRA